MKAVLPAKRTIAVISTEDDAHLSYVQRHLDDPMLVLDQTRVLQGVPVSFRFVGGQSVMTYGGQDVVDVTAVWYRKPAPFTANDLPVDDVYKQYCLDGLSRFSENIQVQFQDALWISDPYMIRRASNKTLQMKVAHDLGFRVPTTLSTTSAPAARDFVGRHAAVVKSFSGKMPAKTVFPTTRIIAGAPPDLEGLPYAPAMFQQAIEPRLELRVTVVGDRLFAAAIVDPGIADHPEMRDSRFLAHTGKTTYSPYDDLDARTKKRCIDMVKSLGLKYGAFDFIVDADNKLWFLEVNPNGQWAFIEYDTGLPIGKAIAELLQRKR